MDRAEAEGIAETELGQEAQRGLRKGLWAVWMQPKVSEGVSWEKNDKGIWDKIAKSLQIWELNQRELTKAF